MHPPSPTTRAARFGLGAAALLALAACADTPGEAAAAATLAAAGVEGVEIRDDGAGVSYRTAEGSVRITEGSAARLPDDFPVDVFLPERYVVESTLAMNDDLFVGLDAEEGVPALYAAARESMAGHGWTETMAALENSQNGLLTYEKGDRSAVLSLSREADGTNMGVQLGRATR